MSHGVAWLVWVCPECDNQTTQRADVEVWCVRTIQHKRNRKRKMVLA